MAGARVTSHPTQYRYRVFEVWGEVPDDVLAIVGKDDACLLYSDYEGTYRDETIVDLNTGRALGGWGMQYAGIREIPA